MTTITVEISEQDGVFYATSEEVPGFLLVSKTKQGLDADILPAMKKLLAIRQQYARPQQKVAQHRLVERRQLVAA